MTDNNLNDTVYFDLTNPAVVQEIKKQSIEDLLYSMDSSEGTFKPFSIIFKMNGLLQKKPPDFWKVIDQFRETNYSFTFIAVFVDQFKVKDSKAEFKLPNQLKNKKDITPIWIPGPTGLKIDSTGSIAELAKWDKDLDGENAIAEFIEILKIPEVFQEVTSDKITSQNTIFIPGFKKVSVGFGDRNITTDVIFNSLDTISGNLKTADTVTKINISRPSEMQFGTDLDKNELLKNEGEIYDSIQEIKEIQNTLLDAFGLKKNKNSSIFSKKVNRVRFNIETYQKSLKDKFNDIKTEVNNLSEDLASFASVRKNGITEDDFINLQNKGIDVSAEKSELVNQGDELIRKISGEIISNLEQQHTLQVILPTLDNEIEALNPRTEQEIKEKIQSSYKVKLFETVGQISETVPKFLNFVLGKKILTLFFYKKSKEKGNDGKGRVIHLIFSTIILFMAIFLAVYINGVRADCSESEYPGMEDSIILDYSLIDFYSEFVLGDSPTAEKCQTFLWTPSSYDQAVEDNDYEAMESWSRWSNRFNSFTSHPLVELSFPLLILYSLLVYLSFILLLISDYYLKLWARKIGFSELAMVAKNLETNIGDVVINDIKYGYLKGDLVNKVKEHKEMLEEVKKYFELKKEELQEIEVGDSSIQTVYDLVNPAYSEIIKGEGLQDQEFFDMFVKVGRVEILNMIDTSIRNNKEKLFGMKTSNFSKASFQELEGELEKYIKLISEKGILEAESNVEKIKMDKQQIKQRLWKSPKVESEIEEKVFKVNKNSEIMQMVDQHNVNLLDTKKNSWHFFLFAPERHINDFSKARVDNNYEITKTKSTDSAGYIRLIPVKDVGHAND